MEIQEYLYGSCPIIPRYHDNKENSVGMRNYYKEQYGEEHEYILHQKSGKRMWDYHTSFRYLDRSNKFQDIGNKVM